MELVQQFLFRGEISRDSVGAEKRPTKHLPGKKTISRFLGGAAVTTTTVRANMAYGIRQSFFVIWHFSFITSRIDDEGRTIPWPAGDLSNTTYLARYTSTTAQSHRTTRLELDVKIHQALDNILFACISGRVAFRTIWPLRHGGGCIPVHTRICSGKNVVLYLRKSTINGQTADRSRAYAPPSPFPPGGGRLSTHSSPP